MANKLQVKRSSVPSKVPTTSDLDLGEIGVNTYDGRLFIKKSVGGVESIVDVTAAAAPLVPSGTKMMFVQTAAPTGWTKDTTHDNKALRVVSGTAGSGGSVAFTTAFASQAVAGTVGNTTATNQATTATNQATTAGGTVGATTLTISQIPSHAHTWGSNTQNQAPAGAGAPRFGNSADSTSFTGGSGSHTHSFTGTSHNHTQDAHNHTQDAHTHTFTGTAINLAVQYVDIIIATKD